MTQWTTIMPRTPNAQRDTKQNAEASSMRKYTEQQLRDHLLTVMGKASNKDMAKVLKISPQYLHDFLKGRREPGPSICRALGVVKQVRYVAE